VSPPEIVFAFARGQNAFFHELAEALIFELDRLGAKGRIVVGEFPTQREGSVTVLLPPHEFAALSQARPSPAMLQRCVTISAEQPSSEFFKWNVDLTRDSAAVLDINRRAVRSYAEQGIPADHLQLGYCELWDRRGPDQDRDIDILFVGRSTPRRERALAYYADQLERFNCEILLSDDSTPNTGDGVNFHSGEAKRRLLSRTKVLLNVHGEEEPYFEWLRVAEAMSAGCAVVTENSTDLQPLRVGVDLLSGRLETLGLLSAWLAEDVELRSRLVRQADSQLRQYATLAEGATTLLAAAERADQAPVATRASRDSKIANAKSNIYPPLWTGPKSGNVGTPEPGHLSLGDHRILRALKRQQQEMLSFRRQLASAILSRSRPERPRAETVDLATTAGWEEADRPRVSVIVPLYNDKDVVIEALDSVVASTFKSWEIVVVDDASSDDGTEVVRSWMGRHDGHSVALVRHEVNRGLSAARNSGVAKARGRLLLMLDSDNLMRPFGMARLVRALAKDPRAAFAYGILDRFREDGPEGLVSEFGWEPGRFRDGNYIDALAMIRRDVIEELGGYSEDARLMLGYEDYDLWARIAEQGRWAIFVRQFVARYRVGHSSMLSITNISKVDAMAAVAEHAPTLMRGIELQS
jgi:hypothetical protein